MRLFPNIVLKMVTSTVPYDDLMRAVHMKGFKSLTFSMVTPDFYLVV